MYCLLNQCLTTFPFRSVDCNVRRYDIRLGNMVVDHIGQPVTSVVVSKDGQCILASSLDNTIRLLDKNTGELLNRYGSITYYFKYVLIIWTRSHVN